ncbi:MAG: 4Fe-4S dicluster domain-containing protein [Elusimicrobia bacterium]|nr:4Fe-4S dicluster domain-containing protein [Elusimicrobiota bacterium]
MSAGVLALAGLAALAPGRAFAADAGAQGLVDRMRQDLARALKKPAGSRRWAMAIDLKKCIGCRACTVACVSENKTPPGMHYRPVYEEAGGSYPAPKRKYTPRPCMHCEKPACLEACPEKAIKRRDDGIVYVDYDLCKGAQACVSACPYDVPLYDEGKLHTDNTPAVQPYEKAATFEMGVKRSRSAGAAPVNRARKCTYCFHRLDAGMLPACTTTCVGHATFFGDLNDSESLIVELSKSGRVQRLKESAGTKPTTFYLV